MITVSKQLLQKYNVQGPRYTSYPPAPSWGEGIGPQNFAETLIASNASQSPLSLYLHLPFCQSLCTFCGCLTVTAGKNRHLEEPYLETLKQEMDWVAAHVDRRRPVVQLHLGGGSPTFHSPQKLAGLITALKERFHLAPDSEAGIEVDPRTTTVDHLKVLRQLGFNRISLGVQDFDGAVQNVTNRHQSYAQTKAVVDDARNLGYSSVNIDLIYGLPKQSEAGFNATIDQVLGMDPDRLAVYSYAHVPWLKKHQTRLVPDLPTEDVKLGIFMMALSRFTAAGYVYIGMDHFAKPTDELARAQGDRTLWRNFMGYTTKAGTDLIAFGMSGISRVDTAFFQNHRALESYQTAVKENGSAVFRGFNPSAEDKLRSRVIQNLLCHGVVIKSEIEQEFSIDFDKHFEDALAQLRDIAGDGLVEINSDRIAATETGRLFLRNLAMPFDQYLPKPEARLFSRTV